MPVDPRSALVHALDVVVRGDQPGELPRDVDPGEPAEPHLAEVPLHELVLPVRAPVPPPEVVPELIEDRVARDRERLRDRDVSHVHRIPVVEGVVGVRGHRPLRRAVQRAVLSDDVLLQGGHGRERLERRPRRIEALGAPVEQRVVRRRGEERPRLGPRQAVLEHRRVVRGVRRERDDLAGARIHHHHRPSGGRIPQIPSRHVDAHREALRGERLHVPVDREHQVVPGHRRADVEVRVEHPPLRVDLDLPGPVRSVEVPLVGVLEAGLADELTREVSLEVRIRQLLLRDLAQVAEHLCGVVTARVITQRLDAVADSAEQLRVLGDVEDVALGDVLGHRDRLVRQVLHAVEPVHDVLGVDVQQRGDPVEDLLGLVSHGPAVDHQDGGGAVADQDVAVAVEDLAAEGLDRNEADLVLVRLAGQPRGRQDLQEPQAGGDRAEHEDHQRGQRLHPLARSKLGHPKRLT